MNQLLISIRYLLHIQITVKANQYLDRKIDIAKGVPNPVIAHLFLIFIHMSFSLICAISIN